MPRFRCDQLISTHVAWKRFLPFSLNYLLEREVIKSQIDEETNRIEMEQAIQQRKEYIHFVTDEIMQHIIDMGIMLFFPHGKSMKLSILNATIESNGYYKI